MMRGKRDLCATGTFYGCAFFSYIILMPAAVTKMQELGAAVWAGYRALAHILFPGHLWAAAELTQKVQK